MDHFKREKAGEMQSLVLDFAQMQIAYNQRMEQQWQQLVPKLCGRDVQQRIARNCMRRLRKRTGNRTRDLARSSAAR